MFESITITKQNSYDASHPIDVGALVECMLFYGKVSIIADHYVLKQLLAYFGIDRLLILMDEGFLNITFNLTHIGVHGASKIDPNVFTTCTLTTPQYDYEKKLRNAFISLTGKTGKGRRVAQKFQTRIDVIGLDNIVMEGVSKSILDHEYFNSAAKIIIENLVPEITDISNAQFHT